MKSLFTVLAIAAMTLPFSAGCQNKTVVEDKNPSVIHDRGPSTVREDTTVRERDVGGGSSFERTHETTKY